MPTPSARFTVADGEAIRLDRFLVRHFPEISRGYLQDLIVRGLIKVNGAAGKKSMNLAGGDVVTVDPFERPEERRIEPNLDIPLKVIWQSETIAVVDKQAGLPTHPNDYSDRDTLANVLLARFPNLAEVGDDHLRPGIVHRLDTDTSGLLLVALTQESFRALRQLFDERKVKKTYLALVLGHVARAGEVTTPIAHHPKNQRKMVAVAPGVEPGSRIREARTLYEPVEAFENFTLVRVRTLTGRMHQVRVHLSSIGHPLAGDRLYQKPEQRKIGALGIGRHFLHACEIVLPVPPDERIEKFSSALPPELEEILRNLRS